MTFFLSHIHAICYGVYCVGGPTLIVGGFASRAGTQHWIRVALWMAGVITLVGGLLGFTILFDSSISPHARALLAHYKTLLGGAALGILLLLFFSGEFVRRKNP